MKKRCTQSSCRKVFNPKRCIRMSASLDEPNEFYVICPYCGKEYRRFDFFSHKIILSISKDLNVEPSMLKSALWQIYEKTNDAGVEFADIISWLEDKDIRNILINNSKEIYAIKELRKKTELNLSKSAQVVKIMHALLNHDIAN